MTADSPAGRPTAPAELATALGWVAQFRARAASVRTPVELRAVFADLAPARGSAQPGVRFRPEVIDGIAVDVGLPDGDDQGDAVRPTIVHFHGGGFTIGGPADDRLYLSRLARSCGARTVSVGYRLAPEDPFPAAVIDGVHVLSALLAAGTDPGAIVVSGESAGGGLAVLMLQEARRRGLPSPAGLVLQSPLVDFTCSGNTHLRNAETDSVTSRASILRSVGDFLAGGDPGTNSPLRGDLAALPPTLLQIGDEEVLLDDSRALADGLRAAGVSAELDVWSDVLHTWHAFGCLGAARRATERVARFADECVSARHL
nr:alpha/beta hydrolase [Gordonia sp. LAM0048]